jgi:hypothetical protein
MKVINNFLLKDYYKELKEIVHSNKFGWFYHAGTTRHPDDKNYMFAHSLYKDNRINSDFYNKFEPLKYFISSHIPFNKLLRIKLNLYPNQGKQIKHRPHHDQEDENNVPDKNIRIGVFNFTTCNGSTVIGNKKIASQENQIVFFENTIEHYGITQTDTDTRIVLNIVFK